MSTILRPSTQALLIHLGCIDEERWAARHVAVLSGDLAHAAAALDAAQDIYKHIAERQGGPAIPRTHLDVTRALDSLGFELRPEPPE